MTQKDRHVAVFMPDFGGGGAERVNLELAAALVEQGIRVTFVVMSHSGELAGRLPAGVSVHSLGCVRARSLVAPMRRAIQALRPDVWVVVMWPYTVPGALAARTAGVPVKCVLQDHCAYGSTPEFSGWPVRSISRFLGALAYRLADQRIAVSMGVARDAAGLFGMEPDQWHVIYNAVPAGHHQPVVNDARRGKESRLLAIGRLAHQKGFDILIQAVALLSDLDLKLDILGQGPDEAFLAGMIEHLGLTEKVVLRGFVHDTETYYSAADLFIASSRFEGLPTVLIEALAHGLKIVSTDCDHGPSEILDHGKYGKLVPVNDPVGLADAIRTAVTEKADPERQRQRAAMFSKQAMVRNHLAVLFPE